MTNLTPYIISILAFIIALTFHEFCHAFTAYLLGDSTAKRMGRLTLNPLAHIDPLGLLFLILIRFGWAKPVPFNANNFSYPRFYSVLVGLAGPFSNILLAIVSMICLHHVPTFLSVHAAVIYKTFLQAVVWINVMLGVFNLLPIPPLDGSHILRVLLPETFLPYYHQFERYSFFVLIILISLPPVRNFLLTAIVWVIALLEILTAPHNIPTLVSIL